MSNTNMATTVGDAFADVTSTLTDVIAKLKFELMQPDTSKGSKECAKNTISRINNALAALNNVG